jgi:Tfp pilus assembly protein PilE
MDRPAPGARERAAGYSLTELMVVVGLLTLVLAVSVPLFHNFYSRTRVSSSAAMVQSLVQKARMSALKEKNRFRVVVHDENATTPNTLELQREQSGSFVTVAGETHTVPEGVRILGTSPSDSMDNVTVTGRGECSSGSVYVYADGVDVGVVTIAATCFSDAS